ncbi:MAG: hypothetical protein JXB45_11590 [Candidatus Krumholzibacteriota bacterium]|nr:hypothetical protein [Candidatus Krumholzibacteriota bacterium]
MKPPPLFCFLAIIVSASIVIPHSVSSRTWHVNATGTGDAPTIQAAIDSAGTGDEIVVAPGYYSWSNQGSGDYMGLIRFLTRDHYVTLRSEMGPEMTTIDAENQSRVIYCHGMNHITVDGFTIKRGYAPHWGDRCGGGFFTHIPGETVRNCIFINNHAEYGGGISCVINDRNFTVENCTFRNNVSTRYGGAMGLANGTGSISIAGCSFSNNHSTLDGGAIFAYNCSAYISSCIFSGNRSEQRGSVLGNQTNSSLILHGSTACYNSQYESAISCAYDCSIILSYNILAFNHGSLFEIDASSGGNIGCCDIYGNARGDDIPAGLVNDGYNVFLDPLFCGAPGSDNYFLRSDSPCQPGNLPGIRCLLIGARGVGCSAVPIKNTTWGGLKNLHK